MDKEVNNNGYEYVDLSLPSGTLWATMNVGAKKPSDAGLYFQWGDISGYTAAQVGTGEGKKKFASDEGDYKFGVYPNYSKYTTPGAALDLEDDAAHIHMGGDWHIPTPTQLQELLRNTTNTWTTQDGVNGRLFTSKSDASKSIFIPAVGDAIDGSVSLRGSYGYVWSSMLSTGYVDYGQFLIFNSDIALLYYYERYYGFSVRGVIGKKFDKPKEKKNDMDRNENLDLREILKDAPKGTKLWSPICGECELVEVNGSLHSISCKTTDQYDIKFTTSGKCSSVLYKNGECVLFPSKENRDWSTFKVPEKHKHFEPYQKVLVKAYSEPSPNHKIWFPDIYLFFEEQNCCHRVAINKYIHNDDNIIPYEGNEDKVGKIVE